MAKEILLTKGLKAIVDDSDYSLLKGTKWWAKKGGNTFYAEGKVRDKNGKPIRVLMHRFLMGVTRRKDVIDHKDWNGLNNQKSNLRICTQAENCANRKPSKKWELLCAGVRLTRPLSREPWSARILTEGKYKHVGYFKTQIEAAVAYHSALREHTKVFTSANNTSQANVNNQLANATATRQGGVL